MKRSAQLSRKTSLARGGPLRRRVGLRVKYRSRFPRRRDAAYRAWVASMPCLVPGCRRPAECCHIKSRGAGGDDVGNCVPMDRFHHQEQHHLGILTFQVRYGLDLAGRAKLLGDAWWLLREPTLA